MRQICFGKFFVVEIATFGQFINQFDGGAEAGIRLTQTMIGQCNLSRQQVQIHLCRYRCDAWNGYETVGYTATHKGSRSACVLTVDNAMRVDGQRIDRMHQCDEDRIEIRK